MVSTFPSNPVRGGAMDTHQKHLGGGYRRSTPGYVGSWRGDAKGTMPSFVDEGSGWSGRGIAIRRDPQRGLRVAVGVGEGPPCRPSGGGGASGDRRKWLRSAQGGLANETPLMHPSDARLRNLRPSGEFPLRSHKTPTKNQPVAPQ